MPNIFRLIGYGSVGTHIICSFYKHTDSHAAHVKILKTFCGGESMIMIITLVYGAINQVDRCKYVYLLGDPLPPFFFLVPGPSVHFALHY